MSKIAIQGNASGTGTLTIAAPNTNTDRTLTLPDATGTLNTSGAVNEVPAGSASAPAIYPTGDSNTGIFFPAADTVAISTGGSERVRVDSSGNVGIGTSSPSGILDVRKSSSGADVRVYFRNTASTASSTTTIDLSEDGTLRSGIQYSPNTGETKFGNITTGSYPVTFYTAGTERARIDSSGNVGIGTSSPGAKLEIKGSGNEKFILNADADSANNLNQISFKNAGTQYAAMYSGKDGSNNSVGLVFITGTTERARINSNGYFYVNNMAVGGTANLHWSSSNGQFFVTSSSRRFKHDITDYDKGLAEVMQMQPKYFVYNEEPSQKQRVGFIAEDFHDLGMTEFVEYWKDENDQDTPSEIGYSNMVAILVKSIQELKAITDAQATRIEALEAEVAALKG